MLFRNDKRDPQDQPPPRRRAAGPAAAAAGHHRLPAHGRAALRRPPEVDPRPRGGDEQAEVHPPRRAEGRQDQRPGRGRHLPRRHARHGRPAAPAPRRHGEGARRGQEARARRALPRQRRVLPRRGGADRGAVRQDHRGRGAHPQRQLHLRELRQAEQEDPARDDHVGGVDRRPGAARRHDRRPSRHQARGQADAPRDARTRPSASRRCSGSCGPRSRSSRSRSASATRVKKQMEKTQKEYYLNEQMRAIQKELGEKDEFKNEIQELEEKIKQKKMSAEAREKAEKELKKLKMMSPMSAEATVVRNYIDWLISLPWHEYTEDKLDINDAEKVLEEDHYGLEKVKQRILEYLAVQSLVGHMKGPILCLVGPPGRRQDVARQVDRARHRPEVRPRVARRRARRGRDPRPPPHLHRRAAGQDHPVDEEGGLGQPGLPARRGRQDVDRLPRRPVVGAARGARPRAEQHLQRPLPRRRLRPLEGDVHHHREHARAHPAAAPGPHGDHPDRGLHRAREAQHREAVPRSRSSARRTASRSTNIVLLRHRGPGAHPPLHEGGRRPEPRARDRLGLPQGRGRGREEGPQRAHPRHRRRRSCTLPRAAALPLRQGRGRAQGRRRHRVSRGPISAASCSPPRCRSCPARASSSSPASSAR